MFPFLSEILEFEWYCLHLAKWLILFLEINFHKFSKLLFNNITFPEIFVLLRLTLLLWKTRGRIARCWVRNRRCTILLDNLEVIFIRDNLAVDKISFGNNLAALHGLNINFDQLLASLFQSLEIFTTRNRDFIFIVFIVKWKNRRDFREGISNELEEILEWLQGSLVDVNLFFKNDLD